MITEGRMAWGEWEIELSQDTPASIVSLLNNAWYSLVRVYSARIPTEQVGLVDGLYTGVLLDRDDRFTIGGCGPIWYLGEATEVNSNDQLGPITSTIQSHNGTSNGNLNDWTIDAIIDTNSGLTIGYVGGPATFKRGSFTRNSAKTILDRWVRPRFGVEYDVTPELEFRIGYVSQVWPFAAPYPIAIRRGMRDYGVDVLNATQLSLRQSVRDRVQRVFSAIDDPATYQVANTSPWAYKNPLGDPLARTLKKSGPSSGATTTAEADDDALDDALTTVNQLGFTDKEITISTLEYDLTSRVRAGDYVYVYDVEEGLFDQSTSLDFNGRTIYPVQLRVEEVSWPLQQGMSVMLDNRHQGGSVTDLTPYIDWSSEQGETSLRVGRPPSTIGRTVSRRR